MNEFEEKVFVVNSEGEIDATDPKPKPRTLRIGNIIRSLDGTHLTPDQIVGSDYFTEPGGRIINTRTGEVVTHGDGTKKTNTQPVHDYGERNK